jgi:hypothetical protein
MIEQRLFTTEQTETTSDDYYTPKWIFDTLGLHFDLDVASPPHRTNVPCDCYYTQADDGLAQEWHGRVFMNPPFSKPTPWVERWIQHSNGIALLSMSKSKWFQTLLWESEAKLVPLPDNLEFVNGNGDKHGRIFMPTALWALGDDNISALHNFGRVR